MIAVVDRLEQLYGVLKRKGEGRLAEQLRFMLCLWRFVSEPDWDCD